MFLNYCLIINYELMATIESVLNLSALRSFNSSSSGTVPVAGDTVYVQYHTNYFDGGGGFFNFIPGVTKNDNDGTIIKSSLIATGRWIRQYDGHINVRFFGTIGAAQPNDGDRIQAAIDYAASNFIDNYYTKGNVVYIPSGNYRIHNTLVLKDGVSIIGDSVSTTFLTAGYPNDAPVPGFPSPYPGSTYGGYMMVMATGRVTGCNISNIGFSGHVAVGENFNPDVTETKTKGCMHFEAKVGGQYGDGGLWNSTFKNINIRNFNGHGIYLDGSGEGDGGYMAPNQLSIFENVYVNRQKSSTHSLLMEGQQGQITFLNCGLAGITYGKNASTGEFKIIKGMNAVIRNKGYIQTAVVSFINSTFQDGEYGAYIAFAECVTFDTCWFENLDLGVTASNNEYRSSKSINIINSRFANASGFGSLKVINKNPVVVGQTSGRCITTVGSEVNAYNNYVLVSDPNETGKYNPFTNNVFALGLRPSGAYETAPNMGIRTIGNSFMDSRLGYTGGILQTFPILNETTSGKYVNLKDTKLVYITGVSGNPSIDRIECSVNAGEIISISTSNLPIKFGETKNIILSGKGSVIVNKGDIATFVKLDIPLNNYSEAYQLLSIFKSTSPA